MVVPIAFGWRHLLFANWPVEADALAAHVPEPLSVQEHDGTAWLSVIPLVNVHLRPRGLPRWAGITLPEVNLRTYVSYDGEPGAYFLSLDADGALSVLGARLLHSLPYFYARIEVSRTNGDVRYTSRRRHPGTRSADFSATYRPTGDSYTSEPGSLAEFLTERHRLYTQSPRGTIRYVDVDHERWTLYPAAAEIEENTLARSAGIELPSSEPLLYYSPGVDVVTSGSRRRRSAGRQSSSA